MRYVRAAALVLALGFPGALGAQSITVISARGFRPTAVLGPHVRYVVGSDSADGTATISGLSVPPVVFTGAIRIEGTVPLARAPERRPFADTIRFDADGRVQLMLAD